MKQHRFDPVSLVFGMVFMLMAAGAVWNDQIDWNVGVWLLPGAVLILGIGLLASAVRKAASTSEPVAVATMSPPDDED
jgi:hypothetical protein